MKNSMKAMCVCLATGMSFIIGQTDRVEAKPSSCPGEVSGIVTSINDGGEVVVEECTEDYVCDEITINGVPDYLGLEVGDQTEITYYTARDEKNIACTVDGVSVRGKKR